MWVIWPRQAGGKHTWMRSPVQPSNQEVLIQALPAVATHLLESLSPRSRASLVTVTSRASRAVIHIVAQLSSGSKGDMLNDML
jgi:hypothetical protein